MPHTNIEIKARTASADKIRHFLQQQQARFVGVDRQCDSYFRTAQGRLKLRQGNIETNLIYYERNNQAGPKKSSFQLMPVSQPEQLYQILSRSAGLLVEVIKRREIYYIGNVKFHIDSVEGLGEFVEIEAGNLLQPVPEEQLWQQCRHYMEAFGIRENDLVEHSYSDMLLQKRVTSK